MKLKEISEGYITQKLREGLASSVYFDKPAQKLNYLYNPNAGFTSDSISSGYTFLPTGVPNTIRKRQYLGLARRPGSLRL